MSSIKCVLVGDGDIGKTSLLTVFTTGMFPEDYNPTIIDNKVVSLAVDGRAVRLNVWDTAGQEDFDVLRKASYPGTEIFLVCYSVDCRDSLANVRGLWLPELRAACPDAAVMLVATKTDLRTNVRTLDDLRMRGEAPISPAEGDKLATQLGLSGYAECSARADIGVRQVFEVAVRAHLSASSHGSAKGCFEKCSLL